jgi:hypothetical protein
MVPRTGDGSQWWVDHLTVPLAEVELMVCLDLVGHRLGPDGLPPYLADTVFVQAPTWHGPGGASRYSRCRGSSPAPSPIG